MVVTHHPRTQVLSYYGFASIAYGQLLAAMGRRVSQSMRAQLQLEPDRWVAAWPPAWPLV